MLSSSDCPQQKFLRDKYFAAMQAYRDMIPAMTLASGNRQDFEQAYTRAEDVRWSFVRARVELERHMQEHGCSLVAEESLGS